MASQKSTPKRPHIGLRLKLEVALRQLGLDPKTCQLDHDPALARRLRNEDGTYFPDANDPKYLVWLDPETHKLKTFGKSKATTSGSDIGEIAKTRRLEDRRLGIEKKKRGPVIRSRGFDKRFR